MSYANDFTLTFTQCKQLIANGYDLREFLEAVTTEQPQFIKSMGAIDSIAEMHAINQGGCESGAYMPAVTYHTALECMANYPQEVQEGVEFRYETIEFDLSRDSISTFASKLVAAAVESWVSGFNLDGVNWD